MKILFQVISMAIVCWLFVWNFHAVLIISSIITSICYCELNPKNKLSVWNCQFQNISKGFDMNRLFNPFKSDHLTGLVGVLSWWGADLDPVTQVTISSLRLSFSINYLKLILNKNKLGGRSPRYGLLR